jgi:hypothetical protein
MWLVIGGGLIVYGFIVKAGKNSESESLPWGLIVVIGVILIVVNPT